MGSIPTGGSRGNMIIVSCIHEGIIDKVGIKIDNKCFNESLPECEYREEVPEFGYLCLKEGEIV